MSLELFFVDGSRISLYGVVDATFLSELHLVEVFDGNLVRSYRDVSCCFIIFGDSDE